MLEDGAALSEFVAQTSRPSDDFIGIGMSAGVIFLTTLRRRTHIRSAQH